MKDWEKDRAAVWREYATPEQLEKHEESLICPGGMREVPKWLRDKVRQGGAA